MLQCKTRCTADFTCNTSTETASQAEIPTMLQRRTRCRADSGSNMAKGNAVREQGGRWSRVSPPGRYSVWPPMNSRRMDVGGMAAISDGCRATM